MTACGAVKGSSATPGDRHRQPAAGAFHGLIARVGRRDDAGQRSCTASARARRSRGVWRPRCIAARAAPCAAVSTPSARNPGSTACTRQSALTSSPAPTSSITVHTTSAMHECRPRSAGARAPAAVRDRSASEIRAARHDCHAGPMPNATVGDDESMTAAKPNTRQSISGVAPTGNAAGTSRARSGVPTAASGHPDDAAHQREDQTFREQLPQQPEAARADRDAHRHLLAGAPARARATDSRGWCTRSTAGRMRRRKPPPPAGAIAARADSRIPDHADARPGVVFRILTLQTATPTTSMSARAAASETPGSQPRDGKQHVVAARTLIIGGENRSGRQSCALPRRKGECARA